MSEHLMVEVEGKENFLNDVLIDLPDMKKDFEVIVEGVTFKLSPDNAEEFCMDYTRDNYGQEVSIAARSLKNMHKFCYNTLAAEEVK